MAFFGLRGGGWGNTIARFSTRGYNSKVFDRNLVRETPQPRDAKLVEAMGAAPFRRSPYSDLVPIKSGFEGQNFEPEGSKIRHRRRRLRKCWQNFRKIINEKCIFVNF